jgi:hypothetical protein
MASFEGQMFMQIFPHFVRDAMYSATCRTKALIVSMLNVTPPFELRPEYQ